MVLSSAIVCDHDRRIADDRRSMFPYDRRRSQTLLRSAICDLRSAIIWRPAFMFYLLRSSAIVCDHDRRIADDRRSMFPYDRRRSQTIADLIAICDLRSAIIWKPAFSPLATWGALAWESTVSVVFQKSFSFFYPFLKPLQISFKFRDPSNVF